MGYGMRLGNVLAAGGASENPHGILGFSLISCGVGSAFFVLGRQMLKAESDERGTLFRRLSISWWEKHPKLSIAVGLFWMLVGFVALMLYLLWLIGIGGPAARP